MPVLERDPWRDQFFAGHECPPEVMIPTDDGDAWQLFPKHRWVYNKLLICETQGLVHGPHGLDPPAFPVFSKPIYNMKGMGAGSRPIADAAEYALAQEPGHMWMPLLDGEHVSTDVAVVDGRAAWWRHVVGEARPGGTFDWWTVLAEARPAVEAYCGDWLERHLAGYTGIANFETIGGRIIECHLRMSDQWPDLYGAGWVDAMIALYAEGRWQFDDAARRAGYSVVLFGGHGEARGAADAAELAAVRAMPGVSSVQITFHADKPAGAHSMPPGGFRMAIVNCWDLDQGLAARERLRHTLERRGPA